MRPAGRLPMLPANRRRGWRCSEVGVAGRIGRMSERDEIRLAVVVVTHDSGAGWRVFLRVGAGRRVGRTKDEDERRKDGSADGGGGCGVA